MVRVQSARTATTHASGSVRVLGVFVMSSVPYCLQDCDKASSLLLAFVDVRVLVLYVFILNPKSETLNPKP